MREKRFISFKWFSPIIIIIVSLTISCKQHSAVSDKSEIEKRVPDLVSQMTLEEKVEQMTQILLDVVSVDRVSTKMQQLRY